MSSLRSLIDEMRAIDSTLLSVDEICDEIVEVSEGIQQLEVLLTLRMNDLSDRGALNELGYPSPTAFLVDQTRVSAGHAKQVVARANAKVKAPLAHQAWADGRLSTDQAHVLFSAAESVPDEFPHAEKRLVEIVEPLSVRDTSRAVEYWRQSVDGPGDLDLESQMIRRGLSLSGTINGMRRVDGWLTQLAGQAFEAALKAHMPPPASDDTRSARQRRHDALEELANCHLTHEDTPTVGGEKPQISLLTDLDALQGIGGGTHETLDTGDIADPETVRLVACDSSISRIVVGPDSEILDVGRKTRVWSPAQRRAIIARDRHCIWKHCPRPAKWCDIHHVVHWADGGKTSIENGTLLCRFHHVLTHLKDALPRRRRTTG